MQRQRVAEQEVQLGAARDSQMVQLRELREQASAKSEVSFATMMCACAATLVPVC
jgi:hypothetical protein